MLRVVCFKWRTAAGYRSTFGPAQVLTLRSMVARHYRAPHEFVCITDDACGIDGDIRVIPLWGDHAEVPNPWRVGNPSCYRRLKLFSREARELIGERFVVLDLDAVLCGDLRPLWDRAEDFVIWGDTARGTPYNGSMWLLKAGARPQVWERFDPRRSPLATRQANLIGSDQAWIGLCLGPHERKWTAADGVYSFRNELQARKPPRLPANARAVFFHGNFDPWMPAVQRAHPWIREHYV